MTNRWLKGVAVAALTAVGTMAAQAADLPTRKEAPAPIFVPPPFTWTGFYIGVNAGGIWPSGGRDASIFDPNSLSMAASSMLGSRAVSDRKAPDSSAAARPATTGRLAPSCSVSKPTSMGRPSASRSITSALPLPARPLRQGLNGDFLTVNGKNSLTWLGTTRARLGFVATPDNRLMIYATGGVAYGGGNSQFTVFDATTGSFWSGNPSSSRVGWTIGGGVEYAITNNITIKGEYLYADLGSSKFTTTRKRASATANFPGVIASGKIDWNASIFRAGVNYKF